MGQWIGIHSFVISSSGIDSRKIDSLKREALERLELLISNKETKVTFKCADSGLCKKASEYRETLAIRVL